MTNVEVRGIALNAAIGTVNSSHNPGNDGLVLTIAQRYEKYLMTGKVIPPIGVPGE